MSTRLGLAMMMMVWSVTATAEDWSSMKGWTVVVQKHGGAEVKGELSYAGSSVVILRGEGGRLVKMDRSDIASIRKVAPAEKKAPATAPALAAASGRLSGPEFAGLSMEIRNADDNRLQKLLLNDARVPRLSAGQRALLLTAEKDSSGNRGVAFALNFLLIPGLGSAVQGDAAGGAGIFLTWGAGLGLAIGGISQRSDAMVGLGVVMAIGAQIAGWIRPWTYETERSQLLKQHLPTRYAEAPKVQVRPFIIATHVEPGAVPGTGPRGTTLGAGVGVNY